LNVQIDCPVEALLKIIGQRWNAYILWVIHQNQIIRFGLLRKNIPAISQKVLTAKLRELEKYGIVARMYEKTIPPTVTYSLTPQALDLVPLMQLINAVAHQWRDKKII
jgi:DNA-binding HxlR family transcriptional regulator